MVDIDYDPADLRVVDDVLNRIAKFRNGWENGRSYRLPGSGELFHYTSVEGLKGIIENNELWASSAYFLNDSSEIIYGCGVVSEVLERWIKTCGDDGYSLSRGLAQDLHGYFGDDLRNKNLVVDDIYLACFCEDGNLLSQWRAYAQSGGYSLAFRFPPYIDEFRALRPEHVDYASRIIKIEYDRTKQLERCKSILDEVLPYFGDPELSRAIGAISSRGAGNRGYAEIRRILADMLIEEVVGFKNEAFAVEKEWRIVVRKREVRDKQVDGERTPAVYFRPARGLLIPYVRLTPSGDGAKIPLVFVRSGPTVDRLSAFLSLRPFLDKYGFNAVGNRYSDISVRF